MASVSIDTSKQKTCLHSVLSKIPSVCTTMSEQNTSVPSASTTSSEQKTSASSVNSRRHEQKASVLSVCTTRSEQKASMPSVSMRNFKQRTAVLPVDLTRSEQKTSISSVSVTRSQQEKRASTAHPDKTFEGDVTKSEKKRLDRVSGLYSDTLSVATAISGQRTNVLFARSEPFCGGTFRDEQSTSIPSDATFGKEYEPSVSTFGTERKNILSVGTGANENERNTPSIATPESAKHTGRPFVATCGRKPEASVPSVSTQRGDQERGIPSVSISEPTTSTATAEACWDLVSVAAVAATPSKYSVAALTASAEILSLCPSSELSATPDITENAHALTTLQVRAACLGSCCPAT